MIGVERVWRTATTKIAIASVVSAVVATAAAAIAASVDRWGWMAVAVCAIALFCNAGCAIALRRAVFVWRRAAEFEQARHEVRPARRRGPRGWLAPRSISDLV